MALDYIPDTITEEAFYEKIYSKTKSDRSLTTTQTHIRHFKFYCKDSYNKEAIEILQDLKSHVTETQSIAKVLTFLDGWRSWALKSDYEMAIWSAPWQQASHMNQLVLGEIQPKNDNDRALIKGHEGNIKLIELMKQELMDMKLNP